jgi:tetratricopeptide (TPR) repeat protein
MPYLEKSLSFAQRAERLDLQSNILLSLSVVSVDDAEKIQYLDRALAINTELLDNWQEQSPQTTPGFAHLNKYVGQLEGYTKKEAYWLQATILMALGLYHLNVIEDPEKAIPLLNESLHISRELKFSLTATVLSWIGKAYYSLRDYNSASRFTEEALKYFREIGDKRSEIGNSLQLANILSCQGDHERSLDLTYKSLAMSRKMGERILEGNALNNLGYLAQRHGDIKKAREYYEMSLEIGREYGNEEAKRLILKRLASLSSK